MNIKIELISESDLADESFNIVIDGLKPRENSHQGLLLQFFRLLLYQCSHAFSS